MTRFFGQGWPLPLVVITSSVILLFAGASAAVEIQPGQTYASGTSLSSRESGITTTVPQGWTAAWPEGSEMLVMARDDEQAYLFVAADELSKAEAVVEMSQTIPLGDGVVLHPKDAPQSVSEDLLRAEYRVVGTERPARGTIWTRIGPHGVSAAFFSVDIEGAPGHFLYGLSLREGDLYLDGSKWLRAGNERCS